MKTTLLVGLVLMTLVIPDPSSAVWSTLGSGMDGSVYDLLPYDGDVVAAGWFSEAGGTPVHCLARWNGASWSDMGAGLILDPAQEYTMSLAIQDGDLIVGGSFFQQFGSVANCIARWDGSGWGPLGSGTDGNVYALCIYNGDVIAAGDFSEAGGAPASHIARWDGLSWSPLGSGMDENVWAVAVYNGDLIAAGYFHTAGGVAANHVARWNGASWSPLGLGMDYLVRTLMVYEGVLVAGGNFTKADGVAADHVATWDGASWTPLGSGVGLYPQDLAVYNGDLIAGGLNAVSRWDGATWTRVGEATGQGGVQCLAPYLFGLIAGGEFRYVGSLHANGIARWDDQPVGACCLGDGSCTVTTLDGCIAPGIFQGPGTACDPNPCLRGACCLQTICDLFAQPDCVVRGGVFMGFGSLCEPNPCVSGVDAGGQATGLSLTASPNPSTGQVVIRYTLPKATALTIEVFDAAGSLVRRIKEGRRPAGAFSVPWDGRDDNGRDLPTGVYFARIVTGQGSAMGRAVIAR